MTKDFHSLWSLHGRRVYWHCVRQLGRPDAAEEVTQRVAVIAWRGADNVREAEASLGWLLRIADRQVLNYLRSERRAAVRERRFGVKETDRAASPGLGDGGPLLRDLICAAGRAGALSEEETQVLLLRASMPNASWAAIGLHLGISDRAAAKRHLSAIRVLQSHLVVGGNDFIGGSVAVAWAIERAPLSGEERVVICKCLAAKSAEFLANKERAALWSACLKILRSAGAEVFGEKI